MRDAKQKGKRKTSHWSDLINNKEGIMSGITHWAKKPKMKERIRQTS